MPVVPDPAATEVLRRFLADRDAPCPACSYNLRGLTSNRCPECNQSLMLQVALTEPRMASFVAGIVALSCGPGFCGVLLVYAICRISVGRGGLPARDLIPLVCGTVFGGVALFVWTAQRRPFLSAGTRIRWCLVAAAALIGMAFPGWFFRIAG